MIRSKPVQSYLSYSLATAHRKVHLSLARRLKQFGLQVEAWRVLEVLGQTAALSMGDLAELVLLNPPTLTKLVDRMVADGLVQRQVSEQDSRRVNLGITALGRKRIRQVGEQARLEEEALSQQIGVERADLLRSILGEIGGIRN